MHAYGTYDISYELVLRKRPNRPVYVEQAAF